MSIQAMVWVLEHSRSAGFDRLVLIAIANHADSHDWMCWPSVEQICQEANVSRATAFRSLASLKQLGELEVVGGRGRGRRNHYRIAKERSQAETLNLSEKVSEMQRKGLRIADKRSHCSDTEPSVTVSEPRKRSQIETQKPQPKEPPRCDQCHRLTYDCTCGQPLITPGTVRNWLNRRQEQP